MVWKRFELFRAWATALLDVAGPSVEVLVAGSEGDASRDLVEGLGFHYVETPNSPIGRKANLRLAACRDLAPDYVILCGSDDIVSQATFDRYRQLADQGIDEVCINDIYYLNAHTGDMAYSPGYVDGRSGQPVAPWRMLSHRMCEAIQWKGWNDEARLYLDGQIWRLLETVPHSSHRIHVKKENLFVCDVKSQVSLTPWQLRPHFSTVDPSILSAHLSPKVLEALEQLKGPITNTDYLGNEYLKS